MIELYEIASRAWHDPRKGSFELYGNSAFKDKKMLVLGKVDSDSLKGLKVLERWELVAFPREDHMERFHRAVKDTQPQGPGWRNPGGIGTLSMARGNDGFLVHYVQAHFKTSAEEGKVNRSLASQYGGWRKRVLERAFEIASKTGDKVFFSKPVLFKRAGLEAELKALCRKLRLKTYEKNDFFVVQTKAPKAAIS